MRDASVAAGIRTPYRANPALPPQPALVKFAVYPTELVHANTRAGLARTTASNVATQTARVTHDQRQWKVVRSSRLARKGILEQRVITVLLSGIAGTQVRLHPGPAELNF
jgi:hypothetical protein